MRRLDSELEKAMGLPDGHFANIRKAMAAVPANIKKQLKAKGYPRLKVRVEKRDL